MFKSASLTQVSGPPSKAFGRFEVVNSGPRNKYCRGLNNCQNYGPTFPIVGSPMDRITNASTGLPQGHINSQSGSSEAQ